MQSLTTYIQHPELMDAAVVQELQQMVERHPSFQPARQLFLLGLFQLQDERFGAELRKAAINLPDRRKLFELFDSDYFQTNPQEAYPTTGTTAAATPSVATAPTVPHSVATPADETTAGDRTQTLIDSFLDQQPQAPQPRHPVHADASVDYMSYLMQLEDAKPVQNLDNSEEDDDELSHDDEDHTPKDIPTHVSGASDTYFTETLARIYIKQGKYAKAIEIIRRISLIYPKKNRYFADQIRFLEKLIINERAQNEENNK